MTGEDNVSNLRCDACLLVRSQTRERCDHLIKVPIETTRLSELTCLRSCAEGWRHQHDILVALVDRFSKLKRITSGPIVVNRCTQRQTTWRLHSVQVNN